MSKADIERDAARYRWLREHCERTDEPWWAICPPAPSSAIMSREELDETIDRARSSINSGTGR